MDTLWLVLVQFIFRATLGVAASMALTPPRLVTTGFYRVHLWVLMGANTFAALVAWSNVESFARLGITQPYIVLGLAAALALVSYLGAVIWMYGQAGLGTATLGIVAFLSLGGAVSGTVWNVEAGTLHLLLQLSDLLTGGLVLGVTLTAMFLGHWYLNTPTMQLAPLKRLVLAMGGALVARIAVSGIAAGLFLAAQGSPSTNDLTKELVLLALRWLAGIVLPLGLAVLTWQTLRIPNTQSATGILYAAVILTFIGELTSQLLSTTAAYPL